jgi:hypothetical protein
MTKLPKLHSNRYSFLATTIQAIIERSGSALEEEKVYRTLIHNNHLHIIDYAMDPYDIERMEAMIKAGDLMPYIPWSVAKTLRYSSNNWADPAFIQYLVSLAQHEIINYRPPLWRQLLNWLRGSQEKAKRS